MLIQFIVENFLSFKEKTVFSLLATKDDAHPEHLITDVLGKNKNILRTAAIYGANASGKSNLIEAMTFARDLILEGTGPDKIISVTPYKLGAATNEASRFQFTFAYKGVEYSYGFKLNTVQIMEEFLYATFAEKEARYFERVTSDKLETEVDLGPRLTKGSREKRQFLKYKEADTRPNQLYLTTIFDGNIKNRVPELIPVMEWFGTVLTIIGAEATYGNLGIRTHTTKALKDFLGKILNASDTGIEEVQTTEALLEWDRDFPGLPSDVREGVLQIFKRHDQDAEDTLDREAVVEIKGPDVASKYIHKNEAGELMLLKLSFKHKGGDGVSVDFQMHEESDGTQRIVHLAPMLFDISEGKEKVVVLDELDRRLHPHLSRLIVKTALQCPDKNQIIFTTHDTNLLDLELLRRDEIWFVEKNNRGISHLYSLAEFKVRPDLQIEKGYLNGRFGAIPFVSDIDHLGWNDVSTTATKESIHA